jgi:hypothetical protein
VAPAVQSTLPLAPSVTVHSDPAQFTLHDSLHDPSQVFPMLQSIEQLPVPPQSACSKAQLSPCGQAQLAPLQETGMGPLSLLPHAVVTAAANTSTNLIAFLLGGQSGRLDAGCGPPARGRNP